MGFVTFKPHDDENAEVIADRPDFHNWGFGITEAKSFPPFVFSTRGTSCLIHGIQGVELHWYRIGDRGGTLVKQKRPMMIARTHCSQFFRLEGNHTRTCKLPDPKALICGRCNGETATFGRHGWATKAGIKRSEAHVKLGCVVKGY